MNADPVAIIGFGCAGINAAIGLRDAGYVGPIDVFSDAGPMPYSPILTSYYVSGDIGRDGCFPWSKDEIADLRLNVHEEKVLSLDPSKRAISTDYAEYLFSKCVIATGSRPMANGFPSDCGYEPLMLRSMQDADVMKEAFTSPGCRRVLISGASMVALKILESALANGLMTELVGMSEHILDFNALPEAAERFERGLEDKGVKLRLGTTISEVEEVQEEGAYQGRSLHVTFSNGEEGYFDEICVAHGMACNLDFLEEGDIEMGPGILVDSHMRSSCDDVYAAGDVAQAIELVSGKRRIVGIWKNAAVQGQVAGCSIATELAGRKPLEALAYPGSISSNTIAVDGSLFISGGTIDLSGKKEVQVTDLDDMTVLGIFDRDRLNHCGEPSLVGFNISCDHDEAGGRSYEMGGMMFNRILTDCSQ